MNMLITLAGHWTFQSLLYMDQTERWFKLTLDVLLTVLFSIVLNLWWSWPVSLVAGFVLAHTVNFLFNAQMCALAANYDLVHTSHEEFTAYVKALANRAEREPSIRYAAICGSLTRETWREEADLDVRILRHPGFINGLRAAWFVLKERTRAQFTWFPLDIYLFDSEATLRGKLRTREVLALIS